MNTREQAIATWCKRFQIDLGKLSDCIKSGELIVYEKGYDGEVNVTDTAMAKIKQAIIEIEAVLLDE